MSSGAPEQFQCSPFDCPDSETRDRINAAHKRWAETWIGAPLRDVLRVSAGELSSRELLLFNPRA